MKLYIAKADSQGGFDSLIVISATSKEEAKRIVLDDMRRHGIEESVIKELETTLDESMHEHYEPLLVVKVPKNSV